METSPVEEIPVNDKDNIPKDQPKQPTLTYPYKASSDLQLKQDNIIVKPFSNKPNNELTLNIDMNGDIYKNKDIQNNYNQTGKEGSNDVIISPSQNNYDLAITSSIKRNFMLKVFGILLFQFLITFAFIFITQIEKIKLYLFNHYVLCLVLSVISLVLYVTSFIIFSCKPSIIRKVPANYIILFLITISMTIMLVFISIEYSFQYILGATTFLIAICLAMFSIALFNKIDIKYFTISLVAFMFLAIAYGLLALIVRNYYLIFLYCMLGGIVFALFIAYDTILIRDKFDIDDYIFAALTLYFDIIRLFIFILRILGSRKN
jgi:FtsH-binding integral membrane protein